MLPLLRAWCLRFSERTNSHHNLDHIVADDCGGNRHRNVALSPADVLRSISSVSEGSRSSQGCSGSSMRSSFAREPADDAPNEAVEKTFEGLRVRRPDAMEPGAVLFHGVDPACRSTAQAPDDRADLGVQLALEDEMRVVVLVLGVRGLVPSALQAMECVWGECPDYEVWDRTASLYPPVSAERCDRFVHTRFTGNVNGVA